PRASFAPASAPMRGSAHSWLEDLYQERLVACLEQLDPFLLIDEIEHMNEERARRPVELDPRRSRGGRDDQGEDGQRHLVAKLQPELDERRGSIGAARQDYPGHGKVGAKNVWDDNCGELQHFAPAPHR